MIRDRGEPNALCLYDDGARRRELQVARAEHCGARWQQGYKYKMSTQQRRGNEMKLLAATPASEAAAEGKGTNLPCPPVSGTRFFAQTIAVRGTARGKRRLLRTSFTDNRHRKHDGTHTRRRSKSLKGLVADFPSCI